MTATGSRVHGCSGARVPVLGFFGSTVLRFGVPRFNGSALFAFDSSCPRARPHWWDCSKITKQPRRCGRRSPRQNQQWFDFCLCEVAAIVSIEQMIGRFHERAVCDAQSTARIRVASTGRSLPQCCAAPTRQNRAPGLENRDRAGRSACESIRTRRVSVRWKVAKYRARRMSVPPSVSRVHVPCSNKTTGSIPGSVPRRDHMRTIGENERTQELHHCNHCAYAIPGTLPTSEASNVN